MANINIFALGGQDENGKDLFVLEHEKDIYLINAGIKFPINDRWGVDGIIADTDYLQNHKSQIKGLFLTHAHDEVFAALPWLLMDFPGLIIYGSKFTLSIARNRIAKYKIGHSNYRFKVMGDNQKIGQINIKSFPVASSIPGSLAYNFQTSDGDILFISNLTLDKLGPFGQTNLNEIKKQSKNILVLMQDTRKANFNGFSASKKSVKPLIDHEFAQAQHDQRIIMGAYDEEMYTIQEVIDMANKYNRPIAFYGSAFDTMYKMFLATIKGVRPPRKVIDYRAVNKTPNAVVLVTGTWSRLYQRFHRIASNSDVYLKLKSSDHIIAICPPINGMEVEYSQTLDAIAKIAPNIISISDKDFYKLRATKDDLFKIISTLKPQHFIPTSALYRYQVVGSKQAVKAGVRKDKIVELQNGKVLYLKNGSIASQKGRIKNIGDVIIQGFGVGDVSFEVIRERKNLSAGGVISIAVQLNKQTNQLVGKINTQLIGVAPKSEINNLTTLTNAIVIEKFEQAKKMDYREIQNSIRKRVQKVINKVTNKEPLVVMTFYEI